MRLNQRQFLVMRLAPMIGRPDSPRRIAVAYRASYLDEALSVARFCKRVPGEVRWIQRRDWPAHRKVT